jgi:acetoin:2,6-dichlorophenolindophenol oxidoreductase subunit alpha
MNHTPCLNQTPLRKPAPGIDPTFEFLLDLWRTMLRIRRAEETIAEMLEAGPGAKEIGCPCHLYIGQEAVAAGVCAALERTDTVWGGHRSHGHYLAKGGSIKAMFLEILGKSAGCSGGRGGSMHLFDAEHGILGTVPIVAATVSLGCGAAMAYKLQKQARVAVAFFGDGAVEEGHVHESMNLAAVYRLPVIFICENNLYSSHMHWTERRVLDNLDRAGEFHSIPSQSVDGNDAVAVYEAVSGAVDRARSGGGPSFFECRTFRWRGHVGPSYDLDVGVKRRPELAEWIEKDPIGVLETRLTDRNAEHFKAIRDEIAAGIDGEIAGAIALARRAPSRTAEHLTDHIYTERVFEAQVFQAQAWTRRTEKSPTEKVSKEAPCAR